MSRRSFTPAPRRFVPWLLGGAALATLLLGALGLASHPAGRPVAERVGPAAAENLSEEGWFRLRWQSLLPGMMK